MDNEVEDDAADEAAFNEGAAEPEVKAAATPTATPEPATPETSATPEPAVVEPKYVQITEAQFAELNARVASIDELKGSLDKAFGKIGGIERAQKAIDEWKTSQGISGDLSEDDFTELKADFPELAAMHVKGLNRALSKLKGAPAIDPAKVGDLVQQGIALKLQERELEQQQEAVKALDAEHADWREVKGKPEFKAWIEKQPQRVQKTFAKTWDADFLSDVFSEFKAAAKPAAAPPSIPSTTRKDRLAAAVNPRGTGGHAPAPSDDDDFNAGFKSG